MISARGQPGGTARPKSCTAGLSAVSFVETNANQITQSAFDPISREPNFKQCAVRREVPQYLSLILIATHFLETTRMQKKLFPQKRPHPHSRFCFPLFRYPLFVGSLGAVRADDALHRRADESIGDAEGPAHGGAAAGRYSFFVRYSDCSTGSAGGARNHRLVAHAGPAYSRMALRYSPVAALHGWISVGHRRRELPRGGAASRWPLVFAEHQGLAMGSAGAGNSGTLIATMFGPRLAQHYALGASYSGWLCCRCGCRAALVSSSPAR